MLAIEYFVSCTSQLSFERNLAQTPIPFNQLTEVTNIGKTNLQLKTPFTCEIGKFSLQFNGNPYRAFSLAPQIRLVANGNIPTRLSEVDSSLLSGLDVIYI